MESGRILSAPGERECLTRTESSRSTASEPSRLEDEDDFLSGSESDDYSSTGTGDVDFSIATDLRHHGRLDGIGNKFAVIGGRGVGRGHSLGATVPRKLCGQDVVRHIRLMREVEEAKRRMEEKEEQVEKYREKLARCREHLSHLHSQVASLEDRERREGENIAAVGLLRAQLSKLLTEISLEEAVEGELQESLERAEQELSGAQVVWKRYEEIEDKLQENEGLLREAKNKAAIQRQRMQTRMLFNADQNRKAEERLFQSTLQAQKEKSRMAIQKARKAQKEGRKFLNQTLDRRRKGEAVAEEKRRAHVESRMKALLSLKANIEDSQGTIQAQQKLREEEDKKQKMAEKAEREGILAEGGNPDEELLRHKRMEEFLQKHREFEEWQKEKEMEIVSRLLEEGKMQKKVEKKMAKAHWHNRQQAPHVSTKRLHNQRKPRRRQRKEDEHSPVCHDEASGLLPASTRQDPPTLNLAPTAQFNDDSSGEDIEQSAHAASEVLHDSSVDDEVLMEPEIRGLWDHGRGGAKGGGRGKSMSKLEEEMMKRGMETLRTSIVRKQVAAGREFQGKAFISKPEEALFSDLVVGKTYRRRLQLTNVSYTVNYLKLLGISDNLKNFVSVEFNPPGSMSAGLTCYMVVTFEPKLNEDLSGEIKLLSQTGPISIPVRCLTKKCLISADCEGVEFGRVCVGEVERRTVVLRNAGALPTAFHIADVVPSAKSPSQAMSSLPVPALSSSKHLSDESQLSIMTAVEMGSCRDLTLIGDGPPKSRSITDLRSVSQRSITWSDQMAPKDEGEGDDEGGVGEKREEGGRGGEGEGSSVGPLEDAPGNQVESIEGSEAEPPVPAITVGEVPETTVPPFSSVSLEFLFAPEAPGSHRREFEVRFSEPSVPPLTLRASGEGLEVPVYVERETMDLQICMMGRLYQDTIIIHNGAPTALQVAFHVPADLRGQLEVLPEHGLVQGESSFAAQLKLFPSPGIFSMCQKYLEVGSGCLDVPLEIRVAGQARPVLFSLCAQVTTSDVAFSVPSVSFGPCTVHDSVVATIQLTNKSILPQTFGFVNLPKVVDVQPNDGFGTLLPLESLSLDIIFSPDKPQHYTFDITCRTGVDRTFQLSCSGRGVLPPLELSHTGISFRPTAIGDTSSARVSIRNPKLSRLNSAVIRGATLPQGPKAFEFVIPEGSSISLSPQVGVVPLGQSVDVWVQFSPQLDVGLIQAEAVRLQNAISPSPLASQASASATTVEPRTGQASETAVGSQPKKQKLQTSRQPSRQSSQQTSREGSRQSSRHGNREKDKEKVSLSGSKASLADSSHTHQESRSPPDEGSDLWWQAHHNLLTTFKDQTIRLSLPCFVSSELPRPGTEVEKTAYRQEDTLYLEVSAPVVQPGLVVVSDNGRTAVDYDSVGTGVTSTRKVTVRNISSFHFHLSSSLLDPYGPFQLRNALRDLLPSASHDLILRFSPESGGKYQETLRLHYAPLTPPSSPSSLDIKLVGEGVEPVVELTPKGDSLDLGHVMAGDTATHTLQSVCFVFVERPAGYFPDQLQNHSQLAVRYAVRMEGSTHTRRRVGASNYNGQPPFSCVPFEGSIEPGKTCDVAISFSPDRESTLYGDAAYISLNDQLFHTLRLRGQGWTNNMYVLQLDKEDRQDDIEDMVKADSMACSLPLPDGHTPPPRPLMIMFVCKPGEGKSRELPCESQRLEIGCIKTPLVKKNSGEFVIEPLPASLAKTFSVDPAKSSIEAGNSKVVTISFTPPRNCSPSTVEASVNLTLKGDSVQVCKLLLRAIVCY